MEGLRRLCRAGGAAVALLAGPAVAQTAPLPREAVHAPEPVRAVLGAWDLQMLGASRLCTVTFAADEVAGARQLRFPATCRRALPVLDRVAGWSLTPTGQPQLVDAAGASVIAFAQAGSEAVLRGRGVDGKDYGLDPKSYSRLVRRAPVSPAQIQAQAAQRRTVVDPASRPEPESVPGRYVVMRQQNREACRLVLSPGPASTSGQAPAAFEGACPDTGLTVFDPVGWRYAAGRLTLVARKGHSVELVPESGQWRKDPPLGASLMLRKLGP